LTIGVAASWPTSAQNLDRADAGTFYDYEGSTSEFLGWDLPWRLIRDGQLVRGQAN
jgi:hypothetical protein